MAARTVTRCQRRERERAASILTGFAPGGALTADRARYEAGNGPTVWALSHLPVPVSAPPGVAGPRRVFSTLPFRRNSRPSSPVLSCVATRCRASSSASSARISDAACWSTASFACTAPAAATIAWSPLPARGASAPPAPGGAWPTPQPTSSMGFFPSSLCASGSSHCRFRSATAWPTTPGSPVRS